ncbi:MAG: hypothetical protein ACOVNU_04075 [Candidatus Kapaibacteriota bacterium]
MNLENDFTPPKQALALNNVGFDEPCFKYIYVGDTANNVNQYLEVEPSKAKNYNADDLCISQPTFSHAFRWFREKHGIHSIIEITIDDKWYFSIFNLNEKRNAEIETIEFYFDKYEQAELACLKKLIEIVKNK